jgi:hypothetical protein
MTDLASFERQIMRLVSQKGGPQQVLAMARRVASSWAA